MNLADRERWKHPMAATDEAVRVIEAAIREHNATSPDKFRVTWGYRMAWYNRKPKQG
jgi:hypothetical protein